MDRLSDLGQVDPRYGVAGCMLICVLLAMSVLRRCANRYETAFVTTATAGLRMNFIVADPRRLFLVSLLLTVLLGAFGYLGAGPVGSIAAVAVSAAVPRWVAAGMQRRRTRRFIHQLPDALFALASTLHAGSHLTKGLELLATRQPAPLGQEFTIVLAEYRVGRPLEDSLADLRRRVGAQELDLLRAAINVSRRVGGNLGDTLETLAKTLREKAHMEGRIDALTSMGRAQGWVVGLLPVLVALVLYQQQPQRMSLLFTRWFGWIVLAVIAAMMTLAAWMIRKIVRIDV